MSKKTYVKRELELTKEDFKRLKPHKGVVLKYSEICKVLRIEMYAGAERGGQQQFHHINKMKKFCKIKRVAGGYLIEKIYNKERVIKTKRKRRCKYADASRIFEYNLAQEKSRYRVLSKNRALEAACFVNSNFSVALGKEKEVAELLEVDQKAVHAVMNYFANKFKICFKNTIKNCRAVKEYTAGVVVARKGIHRLASEKDLAEIQVAETKALAKVRCKTTQGAFVKGKYAEFVEQAKKALKEIDYYYNGYKVEINHKAVQMTERTFAIAKANMQQLVEESILKACRRANADESYLEQIQVVINALIKDTTLNLAEHFVAIQQ